MGVVAIKVSTWRRTGWIWSLGAFASTLQLAYVVSAEPPPTLSRRIADVIEISPDSNCLEHERLVAQVKRWLGRDRVSADVRVYVTRRGSTPPSLSFDLRRGGHTRQRAFRSSPENCTEAHAVLGLAIALAIEADSAPASLHPAPPAVPVSLRLVFLQISGAYQVLPDTALGSQLGAELGWSSWFSTRAETLFQYSPNDRIGTSNGRFDALLATGSLQACASRSFAIDQRLGLCVGGAAGAIHAWGKDFSSNHAATGAWYAARAGLRFETRLGLKWLLDADLISALAPSFAARRGGAELGRQIGPLGFMLSLGPAIAF